MSLSLLTLFLPFSFDEAKTGEGGTAGGEGGTAGGREGGKEG